MVKVRTAKSKGNQFEYDCQASLNRIYSDIYRTSERGFQQQYDLRTEHKLIFECKRLKGISWNQCINFYNKLKTRIPQGYACYLLFKSNNQPCLTFFEIQKENKQIYAIQTFEDTFGVPFIKHESTRKKRLG